MGKNRATMWWQNQMSVCPKFKNMSLTITLVLQFLYKNLISNKVLLDWME